MSFDAKHPDKVAFALVMDRITSHRERYYNHLRPKKSEIRIFAFFECMGKASWDEGEPTFEVQLENYSDSTIKPLVTDVKKYLKLACDELELGKTMEVGKIRGSIRFQVVWARSPQISPNPSPDVHAFSKITVVGNLRAGSLNANIMRGVHSMSSELGIALDDRMNWGWFDKTKIDQDPNPISKVVRDAVLNPEKDSILIRNSDPVALRGNIDLLRREGFHIVTTGFATGSVRQDNATAGTMLANLCMNDHRPISADEKAIGENCIIIMHRYPDVSDNEKIIAMQDSFRSTIWHKSGFKIVDFYPTVSYRETRFDEILDLYKKFLRKISKEYEGWELSAILVPEEVFASAALFAVRTSPKCASCRIYGERIVRVMLEACSESESPFYGTCGAEPYYFGRYAARAASCRAHAPYPEMPPALIIKADALERGIISSDRIPAILHDHDIQCNDERYAWYPWMKDRCPGAYGPDKLKKFLERG